MTVCWGLHSNIYIYIYIYIYIFTDANYVDDIVLLANTPMQTKSLLYSLKQVAGGISLQVNAYKTEYMF